jgi:hypothetical protein
MTVLREVVDMLPSLQVGLDVNVQFHAFHAFEYTSACAIFDLLDMRLVHGWLVDPQDIEMSAVLQHNRSYNHMIETLIDYQSIIAMTKNDHDDGNNGPDAAIVLFQKERGLSAAQASGKVETLLHDGAIVDRFLAESASQLTYFGLIMLHEGMKERELAVFFRNNHFSTLFKVHEVI